MSKHQAISRASAPQPRRERRLPRPSIVHVIAVASVGALALVLLPPERPLSQRGAPEVAEEPAIDENPSRVNPADAEAITPPPPLAPTKPSHAPARAALVELEPMAAEEAPDSTELYLSVAERREAEEERRLEATSDVPSPQLIETPAEQAAMNAVAKQRELERNQLAEAREAREEEGPNRPPSPEADADPK